MIFQHRSFHKDNVRQNGRQRKPSFTTTSPRLQRKTKLVAKSGKDIKRKMATK